MSIRRFLAVGLMAFVASASALSQPFGFASIARRSDVVALVADVRTGRLLGGIRSSEARSARYHPASLFKLAIAVAALDGHARIDLEHVCHGTDTISGHAYRCWLAAGHGRLGFVDGLAHSCNLYFRQLARGVSREAIASSARALGLLGEDASSTIDDATLLGEAALVTPQMMLRTALTLASRGRLAPAMPSLGGSRYEAMYRGLVECVQRGTARAAWSRRIRIAGKTGTAEVPGAAGKHVGWFVGFAPARNPSFAIVVLHREGMGSDAAAIAREMLETLL